MAQARTVMDYFGMARGGYCLNEANKEMQDLVKAIKDTGMAGEVTLTLKIKPDKNDPRLVTLEPDFKIKKPRKKFSPGHAFITSDNGLSRDDPAQLELLEEREREGVRNLQRSEAALEQVGRGNA